MKLYIYNGETYTSIPNPLRAETGDISPVSEAVFVANGGIIEDDGEETPEEKFADACRLFRALCDQIGQFIGDASFQGGFDEYANFANSQAYQANPVQGNALAIQWSALNELCKYKGALIGLGQPDWWYRCWELLAEEAGK